MAQKYSPWSAKTLKMETASLFEMEVFFAHHGVTPQKTRECSGCRHGLLLATVSHVIEPNFIPTACSITLGNGAF
jgi:predicted  nucleic acid-binding Zn-ribbon protein